MLSHRRGLTKRLFERIGGEELDAPSSDGFDACSGDLLGDAAGSGPKRVVSRRVSIWRSPSSRPFRKHFLFTLSQHAQNGHPIQQHPVPGADKTPRRLFDLRSGLWVMESWYTSKMVRLFAILFLSSALLPAQNAVQVSNYLFQGNLNPQRAGSAVLTATNPSGNNDFVTDTVFGQVRTVYAVAGAATPRSAGACQEL